MTADVTYLKLHYRNSLVVAGDYKRFFLDKTTALLRPDARESGDKKPNKSYFWCLLIYMHKPRYLLTEYRPLKAIRGAASSPKKISERRFCAEKTK